MSEASEAITVLFAALIIAATGYEIRRRQIKLRAVYDVLDTETRHIAVGLEQLVAQGVLKPYTEASWE